MEMEPAVRQDYILQAIEEFGRITPAEARQFLADHDANVRAATLAEAPTEAPDRAAAQPPLRGLVRQIRATADEELILPTTYAKRAIRDFARDLERWIPEDFEPGESR